MPDAADCGTMVGWGIGQTKGAADENGNERGSVRTRDEFSYTDTAADRRDDDGRDADAPPRRARWHDRQHGDVAHHRATQWLRPLRLGDDGVPPHLHRRR